MAREKYHTLAAEARFFQGLGGSKPIVSRMNTAGTMAPKFSD